MGDCAPSLRSFGADGVGIGARFSFRVPGPPSWAVVAQRRSAARIWCDVVLRDVGVSTAARRSSGRCRSAIDEDSRGGGSAPERSAVFGRWRNLPSGPYYIQRAVVWPVKLCPPDIRHLADVLPGTMHLGLREGASLHSIIDIDVEMKQEGVNIGERKRTEGVGYAEENMFHVLRECEATKSEMTIEEFIGEEGKGLELVKKIDKIRGEVEKENRIEESEGKE